MRRNQFLRLTAGGAAAFWLSPLLVGCGGGSEAAAPIEPAAASGVPAVQILEVPAAAAAPVEPVVPSDPPAVVARLTAEEIADLRFMREEEKLAHDVYVAMYARWGATVFDNIARSETEHTEAVLARLVAHGIDDPAAGLAAGEFENPDLQALYDRLVAAGNQSLVAALGVGALIEETDIQDIRATMAETDEPDVLNVYRNLLCGSYNHLQAFARQLSQRGGAYAAQVISQAEWDAIVAGTAVCTD